jgi:hypothetical protein
MMALDEATQGHLMPLIQKILDKNFTEEKNTPQNVHHHYLFNYTANSKCQIKYILTK